jgi:hypothetical protein
MHHKEVGRARLLMERTGGASRPTSVIQLTELPSPKRSLRPTALLQRTRYAHGPNVPTRLSPAVTSYEQSSSCRSDSADTHHMVRCAEKFRPGTGLRFHVAGLRSNMRRPGESLIAAHASRRTVIHTGNFSAYTTITDETNLARWAQAAAHRVGVRRPFLPCALAPITTREVFQ